MCEQVCVPARACALAHAVYRRNPPDVVRVGASVKTRRGNVPAVIDCSLKPSFSRALIYLRSNTMYFESTSEYTHISRDDRAKNLFSSLECE